MSKKGVSEMLTGVWRIKWWKYRYVIIAAIAVNILLVNHFFDGGFPLNPFGPPPERDFSVDSPEYEYPAIAIPPAKEAPLPAPQHSSSVKPSGSSTTSSSTYNAPAATEDATSTAVGPSIPSSSSVATFNLHDYKFDGEYVGWPLGRVCNETEFVPGLTFVCDNNSGGIGNIRNFILTCIRYAIDAGATELIMPRIQRRADADLANIFTKGFLPFSYFFDEKHFRFALNTFCPQITLHPTLEETPKVNKTLKIEEFYPKDLNVDTDGCDGRGVNRHLDQFRPKFDRWLKTQKRMPTVDEPVSIRFKWATFFEWPIYRDGPEFATTFGDLLRIREDIQDLAATILTEMSSFMNIKPTPDKFEAPYLGIHLRTEGDALNFWPSFDEQSDGYLQQGEKHALKHAYLACGDANEARKFSEKAMNRTGLHVTSKLELLKGEDRKKLDALSWDQQALVDFLVLEKSTQFTGCSFSSFAMNVAFKRHLMTEGIMTRQWKSPGDKYSTLVGRFENWYGDWMFMYECMWA